jgi:hypothetical protein
MLLAVPQELEGKTAANAPGGALAATNAGAAGAAGAAPRRSTATTELAAQPRLPLTAFPQNNRPRVEAQTPVQPPPMLDQAPEPQRPPQPHLHAAPFRAMGGGGGGGGGMRGMGRPRGRR